MQTVPVLALLEAHSRYQAPCAVYVSALYENEVFHWLDTSSDLVPYKAHTSAVRALSALPCEEPWREATQVRATG